MLEESTTDAAKELLSILVARMNHNQHKSSIGALSENVNDIRSRVHAQFPEYEKHIPFPEARDWWPCYETFCAVQALLLITEQLWLRPAKAMIERAYADG